MSRSIFSGVIGAAVLLACVVTQQSHGQDSWNHGFGPRNYGYSGNAHMRGYGYSSSFGDPGRYSSNYAQYPRYYVQPGFGGYSTGAYGYSTAPGYYGYRTYYAPYGAGLNVGVVPPTSPYYQPFRAPRYGNTIYGPVRRARAW
jgi:hypothetical protein